VTALVDGGKSARRPFITLAEDNRRRFRDPFIIKLDMASAEKKIHFLVMPRDDKIVFGGHWFGLKLAGIEF
jgi:hypothetical protein